MSFPLREDPAPVPSDAKKVGTLAGPSLAGPTLADFRAARERVAAVADVTPLERSRYLTEILNQPVLLKAENLQRTGSYKIRGA
jgi:threonine dehydratase